MERAVNIVSTVFCTIHPFPFTDKYRTVTVFPSSVPRLPHTRLPPPPVQWLPFPSCQGWEKGSTFQLLLTPYSYVRSFDKFPCPLQCRRPPLVSVRFVPSFIQFLAEADHSQYSPRIEERGRWRLRDEDCVYPHETNVLDPNKQQV